jgi:hypothetical protein
MPGGRPSDYNDKTVDKVVEYLETYRELDQVIPTIMGLARFLGVTTQTLHEWKQHEDKKEFSSVLRQLMDLQGESLINKGITGEFNSTIAKLILTKHGYHEKSQVEHMGEGGGPVRSEYVITPVKAKDEPEGDGNAEEKE